jgi:hypothetical protein
MIMPAGMGALYLWLPPAILALILLSEFWCFHLKYSIHCLFFFILDCLNKCHVICRELYFSNIIN